MADTAAPDTALWDERNAIFYTPPMCQLLAGGGGYSEEYLAFGVIDHAIAHRAVPQVVLASKYQALARAAGNLTTTAHLQGSTGTAFDAAARDVALLVGQHFALPILIYMLTLQTGANVAHGSTSASLATDRVQGLIRRLVLRDRVPNDWQYDHTIMTHAVYGRTHYKDTERAITCLKLAVQISRESRTTLGEVSSGPIVPPTVPTLVEMQKKGNLTKKGARAKKSKVTFCGGIVKASKSKTTPKRVRLNIGVREIPNLYIDMKW